MGLFTKPIEEYKRHTDLLGQALTDNAKFLSVMTGYEFDYCKNWVKENFKKGGKFLLNNPLVVHTERMENGDRKEEKTPFSKYVNDVYSNKNIIVGTGTVYLPPSVIKSPFTKIIKEKKKKRSAVKKVEAAHEMAKNFHLSAIAKATQLALKTIANSISGGEIVESCPIYLATAHPTLTITCRITANNGGAVLEKFLAGNRHYYNPDITINSIVNTVTMADIDEITKIIKKYGFHLPTVDETISVIQYSSRLYWRDVTTGKKHDKLIREFVSKCSEFERAAIVYVGDFYHLMKFNPDFCKELISETMNPVHTQYQDPISIIKSADEDILNFAIYRFKSKMRGVEHKMLVDHYELANGIANVIVSMQERFIGLRDLIFSLWATDVGPHSIAAFPDSVRRRVPAGDTDSTFASLMDYVEFVHGEFNFSDEQWGTAGVVGYMATSLVTHQLFQMSTNFGTDIEDIPVINMKNEFGYNAFIPSQASKHYIAGREIKEGNVLPEYYLEAKGVSLINTDAPEEIVKGSEKMQRFIINEICSGRKIKLREILKTVADIERRIIDSILSGEGTFLRSQRTNPASSYKKSDDDATFKLHRMWNETFGKLSDNIMEPPYVHKVVPVDLKSKSKLKGWLDDISDEALRQSLTDFMVANDMMNGIGTLRIPEAYLAKRKIPIEVAKRAKLRSVVQKLMTRFYIVLESLGYYAFESGESMLISDQY